MLSGATFCECVPCLDGKMVTKLPNPNGWFMDTFCLAHVCLILKKNILFAFFANNKNNRYSVPESKFPSSLR